MKSQIKNAIGAILVLLFALSSFAVSAETHGRKGTVYVYDNGKGIGKIHTYRAPYKAAANTSTIIELADRLIIIDFQFKEAFAREFRAYTDSLGKPIDRAYLSHEHPDHWLGSIAFQDIPTYALPEVVAFVEKNGDNIIKKKNKVGKTPKFAGTVEAGVEKIGNLTIEFSIYKNSESHNALLIALPELNTLIAQDLLYSNTHLYLGNDNFDNWISSLQEMLKQYHDYQWFIPGHGDPRTTSAIFDENIDYLKEANLAFAHANGNLDKIKQKLLTTFPKYKCSFFVPFGTGIALKNPQQHK